jgi:hypothetical protein
MAWRCIQVRTKDMGHKRRQVIRNAPFQVSW